MGSWWLKNDKLNSEASNSSSLFIHSTFRWNITVTLQRWHCMCVCVSVCLYIASLKCQHISASKSSSSLFRVPTTWLTFPPLLKSSFWPFPPLLWHGNHLSSHFPLSLRQQIDFPHSSAVLSDCVGHAPVPRTHSEAL